MTNEVDIIENELLENHEDVFNKLLIDHTTNDNIIWATNDYADLGKGYSFHDKITKELITGSKEGLIKPRSQKQKDQKYSRAKRKGEVFTPSWLCNDMANNATESLTGLKDAFNKAIVLPNGTHSWEPMTKKIIFKEGAKVSTWQGFVSEWLIEITCGEAPFLVSRYDAVSGEIIPIEKRIGMLDRKLRIVNENISIGEEWIKYAIIAFQSVYGYEWQGDNLLLARENLLYTFIDYYKLRFQREPNDELLAKIADIISWNIWQMDGLKFVIPGSCHQTKDILGDTHTCLGCQKNDYNLHNGIYCKIKSWKDDFVFRYVDFYRVKRNAARRDY